MDNEQLEIMLEETLGHDHSAGTEAFRDQLLARCLKELDDGERAPIHRGIRVLHDEEIEMLAAAGDAWAAFRMSATRA